ncbi:MAG: HIT domain-containing protein [Candidatus Omnitrophota bacterium]|nr:MAG: HIT domain-containing protein [Candidatus Omnitrophota bacterium]
MNKLWAPWRIKYIVNIKTKGCALCAAQKKRNDKKTRIVVRSKHSFAILNTFPYNNGHLMIVPYRHVASLEKLSDAEILDMNKTLIKIKKALKKVLKPEGFNIGINIGKVAGAGIAQHIHIHVVPRWAGDTNFMPVLADTKIVSQSLEELYAKLKKVL